MSNKEPWTQGEYDVIRAAAGKKKASDLMRLLPGRSIATIKSRAKNMGLVLQPEESLTQGRPGQAATERYHETLRDLRSAGGYQQRPEPLHDQTSDSGLGKQRKLYGKEAVDMLSEIAYQIPRKIDGQFVTTMTVTDGLCRTPLDSGDPNIGMVCCARPAPPGKSACSRHGSKQTLGRTKKEKSRRKAAA